MVERWLCTDGWFVAPVSHIPIPLIFVHKFVRIALKLKRGKYEPKNNLLSMEALKYKGSLLLLYFTFWLKDQPQQNDGVGSMILCELPLTFESVWVWCINTRKNIVFKSFSLRWVCQSKVWNTSVLRLLVRGESPVENFIPLYRLEQLLKLKKGNQRAFRLLLWKLQKEGEQRWNASILTMYWPGAHWDTCTSVTEETKPQVWGDVPWNTDSPGLTETRRSQTTRASSATPIPLRLHRAWRHSSSRASVSGKRSRMATSRGTAPRRSNWSCSFAEGDRENNHWRPGEFYTGVQSVQTRESCEHFQIKTHFNFSVSITETMYSSGLKMCRFIVEAQGKGMAGKCPINNSWNTERK